MGCSVSNIVCTASAHNGVARERNYYQLRNVLYYTGNWSLDPQDSKRFPLKAGFHYAQIMFKTGFTVYILPYMLLTGTYKMW